VLMQALGSGAEQREVEVEVVWRRARSAAGWAVTELAKRATMGGRWPLRGLLEEAFRRAA
jgi:hypothetical protein